MAVSVGPGPEACALPTTPAGDAPKPAGPRSNPAGRLGGGPNEASLANAIFHAHRDDPEFGHRFLADEVRDAGFEVSDRTVWKICSQMG